MLGITVRQAAVKSMPKRAADSASPALDPTLAVCLSKKALSDTPSLGLQVLRQLFWLYSGGIDR